MPRFSRHSLLAVLAVLAVLAGCGTTEPTDPTSPVVLETLADIDPYMSDALEATGSVALAAAVVKGERLVWSGGVGQADLATGAPATAESIFLVASISKTVVAAAVMQLVERGVIDLDADINTYLPFRVESPAGVAGITARQLLSHTSGLTDAHYDVVAGDLYTYGSDSPLTLGDFLRAMLVPGGGLYAASTYSGAAPGTAYAYTNLGVALLGYVAEAASGVPFDDLTRTRIFEPLGMNRTAWRLADLPPTALAMPYAADRTPYGHYTFPDYPDGGLRTSVDDLSKFLRAVANGGALGGVRILAPTSVAEMLRVQYPGVEGAERQAMTWSGINAADYPPEVGLGAVPDVVGHLGGERGVFTLMFFDPATRAGSIVFVNTDPSDEAQFLAAGRTMVDLLRFGMRP